MKTTIEATVQSTASPLVIYVHLSNGHCSEFVQAHAQTARLLLDSLQPDRVFLQRQLVLAGATEMTVYSCAAIDAIELVTASVPDWPHHRRAISIREINPDKYRRQPFTGNQPDPDPRHLVMEIEMHGGRIYCLDVEIERGQPSEMLTPLDFDLLLQHSFAGPCLHALRRDSGVLLINSANIVRTQLRSAPPALPPSAWLAHSVLTAAE